jgi:hypothetical protein
VLARAYLELASARVGSCFPGQRALPAVIRRIRSGDCAAPRPDTPGLPDPAIEIVTRGDKTVIRPVGRPERLPLFVGVKELASLELSIACRCYGISVMR